MLELDWDAPGCHHRVDHVGRQRDQLRQQLYARYTAHLLQLDLDALERRLAEASQTFWPLAWFKRLGVYRALKKVSQQAMQADAGVSERRPARTHPARYRKRPQRGW